MWRNKRKCGTIVMNLLHHCQNLHTILVPFATCKHLSKLSYPFKTVIAIPKPSRIFENSYNQSHTWNIALTFQVHIILHKKHPSNKTSNFHVALKATRSHKWKTYTNRLYNRYLVHVINVWRLLSTTSLR